MVQNSWFCQFLADTLDIPVNRPEIMETTALGAAFLAALQAGWQSDLHAFAGMNPCDSAFTPAANNALRVKRKARWQAAVKATLMMAEAESLLTE